MLETYGPYFEVRCVLLCGYQAAGQVQAAATAVILPPGCCLALLPAELPARQQLGRTMRRCLDVC